MCIVGLKNCLVPVRERGITFITCHSISDHIFLVVMNLTKESCFTKPYISLLANEHANQKHFNTSHVLLYIVLQARVFVYFNFKLHVCYHFVPQNVYVYGFTCHDGNYPEIILPPPPRDNCKTLSEVPPS